MSFNPKTRRYFLTTMAQAVVASRIAGNGRIAVSSKKTEKTAPTTSKHGSAVSFGHIKQIHAGVLNVGYVEEGPADGPPVMLLHGWPYDIHSFVEVAPMLAAQGYRVIVPYLRGFGETRFLSDQTIRNGQQSVIAVDVIKLMDALAIKTAVIAGFDWGARTAAIIAALWPARCKGLVSVSGYLIGNQIANAEPLPPASELQWWYQYYFSTERGRKGYDKYRYDFARLIWQIASPKWNFDETTFNRTATSFDNPDHVRL
jgi:pimeloyl-ACP methyl ester carboxylesterase